MRTGGLLAVGGILMVCCTLILGSALIVWLAPIASLPIAMVGGATFLLFVALICFWAAHDDEPYIKPDDAPSARKESSALALFEELSSGVVGNHLYKDTTKSIIAALAAGAALGVMETLSEKEKK